LKEKDNFILINAHSDFCRIKKQKSTIVKICYRRPESTRFYLDCSINKKRERDGPHQAINNDHCIKLIDWSLSLSLSLSLKRWPHPFQDRGKKKALSAVLYTTILPSLSLSQLHLSLSPLKKKKKKTQTLTKTKRSPFQ
jgi:hypothetical protein